MTKASKSQPKADKRMKSPESTMSKSSVKRKFQEKKIRASRSANQSMKSPEPKNVKNTLKKPH